MGWTADADVDVHQTSDRIGWERRQLEAARHGDRAAFAALYDAFAMRLFTTVLLPRLADRDAAQDALSETFQSLLQNLDRVEIQGQSLWPWLATVARNKAIDQHRRRNRQRKLSASFERLVAPLWRQRGRSGAVEQRLEIAQAIEHCLQAINPRYAMAIELRFLEGKTRGECAAELAVELGTFDVVLLRALRAFRAEWVKQFGEIE